MQTVAALFREMLMRSTLKIYWNTSSLRPSQTFIFDIFLGGRRLQPIFGEKKGKELVTCRCAGWYFPNVLACGACYPIVVALPKA